MIAVFSEDIIASRTLDNQGVCWNHYKICLKSWAILLEIGNKKVVFIVINKFYSVFLCIFVKNIVQV